MKHFLARIKYRLWQFKQVLFPQLDIFAWEEALTHVSLPVREQLQKLNKSEKAHVLRVFTAINTDENLQGSLKSELIALAMLHDIGKSITSHSIIFKVAKVVLPIANSAHCIAGARFLKRNGLEMKMVRRVLRHHEVDHHDPILKIFQSYDDRL